MEKRRLGRGLEALLGSAEAAETAVAEPADPGEMTRVTLDRIEQNPYQPRKAFDTDALAALSASIRQHGILQPLVVRPLGDHYQLIAGERRLKAAHEAGLTDVPIRIVDFNDQQVLEAALVENIQRADLNAIEKAQGFHEYSQRFRMTHEALAARLGLDRSTVTNLIRLLELPPEVQDAVRVGQISAGHARALLSVNDRQKQVAMCREVIARGHSVRATEALAKEQKGQGEAPEPAASNGKSAAPLKTTHLHGIEDELRQKLATRVEIKLRAKDSGQFVLSFDSNDDFERLLEVLRR